METRVVSWISLWLWALLFSWTLITLRYR